MARFQYRLQKVFELRERKKKLQEQRVVEAQQKVREIEQRILEKKTEIRTVRQNMLISPHIMMQMYDDYTHHLNGELDLLYQDLDLAKEALAHERQLLVKAQADLEALVKHKEKARDEWQAEENRLEAKRLDEVATQRFFRSQQENLAEETEV